MSGLTNLKKKLAEHGFESNEDYEFALRCVLDSANAGVRCVHVAGGLGRRKTAFAQALAAALGYQRALYHDCAQPAAEPIQITIPLGAHDEEPDLSQLRAAKPLSAFERVLTEACAFSEAERTVLVLDQLQCTAFAEQIALGRFLQTREWTSGEHGAVSAHPRNLLLILISEAPLYHSLQKASFRVLTDPDPKSFEFRPSDFNLAPSAGKLFDALAELFKTLEMGPTQTELQRLFLDLEQRVRTIKQLKIALLGRLEFADASKLDAAASTPLLQSVLDALTTLLGVDEIVAEQSAAT